MLTNGTPGPHWWPLEWSGAGLGFGFGEHADDVGSFIAPPAGYFDTRTTKRHLVLCNNSGCVRSFLLHSRLLLHRSLLVTLTPLARYQSITKVVFTASWLPPHIRNPLAVTFMRRSWKLARFWMLKLASRVFVHKTTCGRIKCLISVIQKLTSLVMITVKHSSQSCRLAKFCFSRFSEKKRCAYRRISHQCWKCSPVNVFRVTPFGSSVPVSAFRFTIFGTAVPVTTFCVTLVENVALHIWRHTIWKHGERDGSFITKKRTPHLSQQWTTHHAYRLTNLLNIFMHSPKGCAAYISPWRPGGSEFSVFTFQRLGMRMAQWNKCMMCWTFLLMHALRERTDWHGTKECKRHNVDTLDFTKQNFLIFNSDGSLQGKEGWTHRRVSHGKFVQLDFIINNAYFILKKAWPDNSIPISNVHRCACACVCPLYFSRMRPYKQQYRRKHVLKSWKPIIDENEEPWAFQTLLNIKIGEHNTPTFDAADNLLMSTAVATGTCARHKRRFTPSDRLRHLEQRKKVKAMQLAKSLTFRIRKPRKETGSGRQPSSKSIWHTRHAGKNYAICLCTVANQQISGRMWAGRGGIQIFHQLCNHTFTFIQWFVFTWPYPFEL